MIQVFGVLKKSTVYDIYVAVFILAELFTEIMYE